MVIFQVFLRKLLKSLAGVFLEVRALVTELQPLRVEAFNHITFDAPTFRR